MNINSSALFAVALFLSPQAIAQAIPSLILDAPVDVELQNKSASGPPTFAGSASGFFYTDEKALFFVTAKHVLIDPATAKPTSDVIVLKSYVEGTDFGGQRSYTLDRGVLTKNGDIRVSPEDDIAAIRIGKIQRATLQDGSLLKPIPSTPSPVMTVVDEPGLSAGGDLKTPVFAAHHLQTHVMAQTVLGSPVFIIGYPKSLAVSQQKVDFNKPLLRSGVLAQRNPRLHSLVVDCAAFKGNSGGPVVEVDQINAVTKTFAIIGVVSEFVPLYDNLVSKDYGFTDITVENSGYAVVVPIDSMIDLLSAFKE